MSDLLILRDVYYIALDPKQDRGEQKSWDYPPLDEDQFFTVGDNSARSKDGRLWPGSGASDRPYKYGQLPHYVRRDLLIGKALFIYWPDTKYKIRTPLFNVPYFPNFGDMELVR